MMDVAMCPKLSAVEAEAVGARYYGIQARAVPLPSERDQNFKLVTPQGQACVLKIAHPEERRERLDFENAALDRLSRGPDARLFPRVVPARDGERICQIPGDAESTHWVRMVTFLPGMELARVESPADSLWHHVGTTLGRMHGALAGVRHPAMFRFFYWDAAHAPLVIRENLWRIADRDRRRLIDTSLADFEQRCAPLLLDLRRGIIHNDFNDHNLLVDGDKVSGVLDFGDMLHSYLVNDVAVACAYAMLGRRDPHHIAGEIVDGYRSVAPLTNTEMEALPGFIVLRLALSVCISARQQAAAPENRYLSISAAPAWDLLATLAREALPVRSRETSHAPAPARGADELLRLRGEYLGRNLSLSYQRPLKIVRGAGQYLYDEAGEAYLDCVNNVCHVGHCHPRVVAAGQAQMAILNTNTRYLHDNVLEYARRLVDTLPAPLRVCYFVNSGSEANELALRLARTHTNRRDVVVLDHAYHGNTQTLIEISPYKFNRKGGKGKPPTTHVAPIPDVYRGPFKADDPLAGTKYAALVDQLVAGISPAAFIVEPLPGCAGQIVLPDGYLPAAFAAVRAAGGVCIADEVQVGFGRVGSHMWGFETQGVVPDVMTFGKPAGNGHPLAGVVTTPEIAHSFANGMEYFNTFGGNPVSCAIGLEVLNVLQEERLQEHALAVGDFLLDSLRQLQACHPLIGDVRGRGLYIGIELVRNRETLEPATREAKELINRARRRRVLLSTDGPFDNVIKIKPPLVCNRQNAEEVVRVLAEEVPVALR
jgi:4-aminobutyrate aminotransferase-like enzyme/Ser/Thr protein kinase RdoA (MazF antagonist)